MSATLTLQEAQLKLSELVHSLSKGQEVAITEGNQILARLVGERTPEPKPRVPGNCRGMITLLVEDDEHLRDFAEYMP